MKHHRWGRRFPQRRSCTKACAGCASREARAASNERDQSSWKSVVLSRSRPPALERIRNMSRRHVRGFIPTLLLLVIAALALFAITQPKDIHSDTKLAPQEATARFVPAAYVTSEAAAPVKVAEAARNQAPATTAEPSLPANSLVHSARAGEAVPSIARMSLPQTPYMRTSELEAAIRRVNPEIKGQFLHVGTQVIVPEIEPQP